VVQICWEANILTFNNKNLFSSSNTLSVSTLFVNGWARMDFHFANPLPIVAEDAVLVDQNSQSGVHTSFSSGTFTGLPVIGFAVETFRPTGISSYAGTYYHRFVPGTPNNIVPQ